MRRGGVGMADLDGHGRGRQAHPAVVGDVYHHLRVLDRHRARGHPHLRRALPLPRQVADLDLPRGGGHDGVRGHDRRSLPAHPRGPHVVRLLADALSEPALSLAELQVAAGLGRLRHLHLPDHQRGVLPRGPRARHRCAPRQRHRLQEEGLHGDGPRLGRLGFPVAPLPPRLWALSPPSPPRSCSPCTAWCPSTSPWLSCRAGTRPSSRPSSWTGPSSPASPWCSSSSCPCATSSTGTRTSPTSTSTPWPSSSS